MRTILFLLMAALAAPALRGGQDAADGFIRIDSIAALRKFAVMDDVKVRMKPGVYTVDQASSRRFIDFTGNRSHFDLTGVLLRVDTALFSRFGSPAGMDGFYRVIELAGDSVVFEGASIETFGDRPGIQSRNKIVNVAGRDVLLRNLTITTSGSSPWGYGSLYGISGPLVRKMNGIRIGWPAVRARVAGCRVHMRAMGHAIFVQGARDTLIEDCQVDGLLRPTDEVLAEKSGLARERRFIAEGADYIEGVGVAADGRILPGEMIALSEDGIRLYDEIRGLPTGRTTIRNCTVIRMRRGICTGLGPAADLVSDCEAVDCVAAGFNIGAGDVLAGCRANARFSEALCCPYPGSAGARVDLTILDSRGGLSNRLLAVVNGRSHDIRLREAASGFLPPSMTIALGSRKGYAFYQKNPGPVEDIRLVNETSARVEP